MTGQLRSRRILLAIGAAAVVLLAAPYAMRRWSEGQLLAGKEQQFQVHSVRSRGDLLLCLLKREPGGLALQITSENHFADPARALAVTVDEYASYRIVSAYLPLGAALTAGEAGQLQACVRGPETPPGAQPVAKAALTQR